MVSEIKRWDFAVSALRRSGWTTTASINTQLLSVCCGLPATCSVVRLLQLVALLQAPNAAPLLIQLHSALRHRQSTADEA